MVIFFLYVPEMELRETCVIIYYGIIIHVVKNALHQYSSISDYMQLGLSFISTSTIQ